ncbi:hypothetical protein [Acidithiobacillus sp.]|jgi:DNA-binding transcriptional regulator GbsR (MarR family)|uniref:hypothetical protein n=1 Tax=Acidithiobacillus sp. TaxID=1872118 RepID=UPI00356836BF
MTDDNQLINIVDKEIQESNEHVEKALREFNANPADNSLREHAIKSMKSHIELLKKAENMACNTP